MFKNNNMEREIWEDVVGYEGLYKVSNLGRVRSLPKERIGVNGVRRKYSGKILNLSVNNRGYYHITLSKEGKRKTMQIHQLVAMAFLEHTPDGHNIVCDHINNDKLNNRLDNLQLITNRENSSKDRVGVSKFTGVYWTKNRQKWRSQIRINEQKIHLGYFHNEDEAGQMYQLALKYIDKFDGNPKEFRQYLNSI